jgi:hypothetical protein
MAYAKSRHYNFGAAGAAGSSGKDGGQIDVRHAQTFWQHHRSSSGRGRRNGSARRSDRERQCGGLACGAARLRSAVSQRRGSCAEAYRRPDSPAEPPDP